MVEGGSYCCSWRILLCGSIVPEFTYIHTLACNWYKMHFPILLLHVTMIRRWWYELVRAREVQASLFLMRWWWVQQSENVMVKFQCKINLFLNCYWSCEIVPSPFSLLPLVHLLSGIPSQFKSTSFQKCMTVLGKWKLDSVSVSRACIYFEWKTWSMNIVLKFLQEMQTHHIITWQAFDETNQALKILYSFKKVKQDEMRWDGMTCILKQCVCIR